METSSCEMSDAAQDSHEMMYLKNQEEREQIPALAKHPLLITSATSPIPHCILGSNKLFHFRADPVIYPSDSVKVGAFYEINHSKLPPKTPEQLKCIRVVMVSEKSGLNVSLRFSSIHSLRMHTSEKNYGKPEGKTLPSMDEKYVIGSDVAADVLFRRISPQEITENRDVWGFWAAPMASERHSSTEHGGVVMSNVVSKKGSCLSQLRFAGLVQWGKRRQVRFLNPQEECKQEPLSSIANEEGEKKEEEICHCDEEEEEKETEEGGEENLGDTEEAFEVESYSGCKRKLHGRNKRTQTHKRAKRLKPSQNIVDFRSKKKTVKNSIERWSAARYKLAEENMLKIMKAKGAVFGKPILRPALRSEARKLIGDTGLLDHLLKHMAGKVAPGGTLRFRRRHNAEGAMEYWLESADLINVRREAGVQDPYWTPPPGWTPGDNPTQDPLCARALKELREEMINMKRDVQELVTKSQEEDLAVVTAANSKVTNLQSDDKGFLIPLKEMYIELANRKAKIEDQMKNIAQSLIEMEEQMTILRSSHYEPIPSELEALPPLLIGSPTTPSDTERDIKLMGQKSKSAIISGEKQEGNHKGDKAAATVIEDKATRIQRLKSGFRICKPQGTFLWPNMTISPKPGFQQDDPFVVPTPPSASSSTTTSVTHLLHVPQYGTHPASPVKPLAEKRPFKAATLCTVSSPSDPFATSLETHKSQSINTNINTSLDLNEVPKDQNGDNTLCGTLIYQRKHHNVAKNHSLLSSGATKEDKEQQESVIRYCEQQQQKECSSSFSQLQSEGEASWLGLAFKYNSLLNATNRN